MTTHLVIPDTQCQPDVDMSFMTWIGNYAAKHHPDKIIHIGDAADMKSLCSYERGKTCFEGRRYRKDIEAVEEGFNLLMAPISKEIVSRDRAHRKRWHPELHLTLGNHEDRISRAVNEDSRLEGLMSLLDLPYIKHGWKVHEFLIPVILDGIAYAHYFTSGQMGRPVANAKALVTKKMMSCVMGHAQNWDIHRAVRADGTAVIGVFVGACYLHDEAYLGPQGNNYDRGIWVLHEVKNGGLHPMYVSLNYLKDNYA